MVQKNEVLIREDNRILLISTRRTTTQEDYPTITERESAVNTTEQTWIFEVGEETHVSRTTPNFLNTFLKIVKWPIHLGTAKVDESRLESRHNIHHNFKINSIRF